MVELQGVTKTYGARNLGVTALADVNLEVASGDYVAIMGPSGSGKTTLLNLVGLLDRPSRGRVVIDGIDTTTLGDRDRTRLRRDHVGFVFQQFHLIPYLTALENVLVPLVPRRIASTDVARAKALLQRVGLSPRARHRPVELSGGEQQRVALARALIHQPQVLLADEPTGNLDAAATEALLALFEELHLEGLTILVATHNERVADAARRTVHLAAAKIVGT